MKITKKSDNSKCVIKLDGDMTIYTATENKEHFEPYFLTEQDISVDMSAVNDFDSTGFQMLLLLERQALLNESTFQVSSASPAVQEVLDLYQKQAWLIH